jgi:putative CocE/NonD family hydrolase
VLRRLLLIFLAVVVVVGLVPAAAFVAGRFIRLPGDRLTACGVRRNQSLYVMTHDGTRIAVDLWFPEDWYGQPLPVILRATRYGRAKRITPFGRFLWKIGYLKDAGINLNFGPTLGVPALNRHGYAVVVADGRGSGASFGSRRAECAPEEIADYGEVIDWIVAQPWSNGRVGAWGISQDALNVEMVASLGKPALGAIATLYTTLDSQFTTAGFGGLYNRENVRLWAEHNKIVDANQPACPSKALGCRLLNTLVFAGAKPVDGADGPALLAEAVAGRRNYDVFESWGTLLYRGDPLGSSGLTMAQTMPFGVRARIESSGIPFFSIYGWLDAGLAFSGLVHFTNFSNPQLTYIGPFSHAGLFDADPFAPVDTPARPGHDEQMEMVADFFDRYLKWDGAPKLEREVRYDTLGAGTWRSTPVWPPAGLQPVTYYFAGNGGAVMAESGAPDAADTMEVDFAAGSGGLSRYRSIVQATDIVYPDRAGKTARLLHYDAPPMAEDMELTGSPVATLYVSSTREDGAFFVYLDDVGPDGKVTYLSEGVLRGLFHKTSSRPGPYRTLGVERAYWKEDAEPLQPGQTYPMEIEMFPVSALLRQGHRLRFSLAGADADAMPRVPESGPAPKLTVYRGGARRSRVVVPMAPFPAAARDAADKRP